MKILKVSHDDNEADIRLNSDELVLLGNILYASRQCYDNDKTFNKLRGAFLLARDLSIYGSIDGFSVDCLKECMDKVKD